MKPVMGGTADSMVRKAFLAICLISINPAQALEDGAVERIPSSEELNRIAGDESSCVRAYAAIHGEIVQKGDLGDRAALIVEGRFACLDNADAFDKKKRGQARAANSAMDH